MIEKIKIFIKEVKAEIKRVVFPGKKQTVSASLGVIIFAFFVAFYLGLLDFIFSKLVGKLLTF